MCVVLLTLSVTTFKRGYIWQDELTLWQEAYSKSPHSGRTCSGLGYVFITRGEYIKAREILLGGINDHPFAYPLYLNLAAAYRGLGDFEMEISTYRRALFVGAVNESVHIALVHCKLNY